MLPAEVKVAEAGLYNSDEEAATSSHPPHAKTYPPDTITWPLESSVACALSLTPLTGVPVRANVPLVGSNS